MINPQTSFYVTGGTLKRTAPSYVARQADKDLYDGLSNGKFCYVLTSRQMGKSSLMVRTAARLREEGVSAAVLDLTAIGQNLSAEQWYDGLLARVGQQLDLEDELEDFWLEHERLGPLQRWMHAIREVVLTHHKERIVIFVDEIDAVRSLPFSTDEFFAGVREFYNRRTEDAEFNRLTFCLLGVATPSDLIRDVRTTPFNIGQRIELTDFTEAEGAPLAEGLGQDTKLGTALINRILYWTGGHPYLTQRLCHAVAQDQSIKGTAGVDRICEALFLSTRAQESDDNLLFVRERILRSEADRASLLDLYAQIRTHKKRVRDDEINPLISILRLSGITRIVNGCHYVRNRIYYRVFDREWVTTNMPDAELRRQRAAYRRGQLRAAAIAGVVLIVMAALAGVVIAKAREANRNALELTRALAEATKHRKIAEERRVDAENQRGRAVQLQKVSDERRAEAEEQRRMADEQKSLAETQRARAEAAALEAERQAAARTEAETLKERAESRLKDDLRYVKSSLESQDWMVRLADHLIALSPPKEATYYRSLKAGTLSQLGQFKAAAEESTRVLELEPNDFDARMSRGYMNMLLDDIEKSVHDFDVVLSKNPKSALGYLNRSISLALLASKRKDEKAMDESTYYYQKALSDIDNAISNFVPGVYNELREDHLSRDVQEEIGRSVLVADESAFYSALYYQRVSLQAIAGQDFSAALAEAYKHPAAKEGYLSAINWAWLHEQHSKTDYAALASQGIMWERVKNKDMALRSYAKFRCTHDEIRDPRYANLATWVSRRMRDLKFSGSPCKFAVPRELKPDASQIGVMVTQKLVAGDRVGAMELLNQAITLEPQNIEFLLKRSDFSFQMRSSSQKKEENTKVLMQSKQDADAVLKIVPSSTAYYYRARTNNWLNASNDVVEPDLRKALELNPTMVGAMTYLGSIIADKKPEEALQLYEQSTRLSYQGAWLYQSMATLQLKLGRYPEALKSIQTAIELKADDLQYYELRASIESKLNRKEGDVERHLAEGYNAAGDRLLRQADVNGALAAYEKAKEVTSALVKSATSSDVACDLSVINEKISSIFDAAKAPTSIEDVSGLILSMDSASGRVREVIIDRGSEDGIKAGAEGEVWSVHSLAGQPDREVKKIGRGEVLSVEPQSAAVRLTLIDPSGNGVARIGDAVELKALVPKFPGRSFLWTLARYHVTYTSFDSKTTFFDYRKLYAHQTPARVNEILDAMVKDIHQTGREQADTVRSAPLESGDLKGKTLRQAMEAATRDDVLRFLKFIARYPARSYGHEWKISERFGTWLLSGAPVD